MLATPRRIGRTAPTSLIAALIARAWSAPGAGGDECVRAWSAPASRNAAAHRRGARVGRADDPAPRVAAYLDIRLRVARLCCSGNSDRCVSEITGVELNAHFCGAFREWVGASQTTAGRSFQGKQRSRYYRVETQLADARPVSFSLGEWCRRTGFSANTACGKMLLGRCGSKRSGARGHAMRASYRVQTESALLWRRTVPAGRVAAVVAQILHPVVELLGLHGDIRSEAVWHTGKRLGHGILHGAEVCGRNR